MRQARLSSALSAALKEATSFTTGANNHKVIEPVRTITMVGACVDAQDFLSEADAGYLQEVFNLCRAREIPLAPDVTVQAMNLEYRDDFLEKPGKSDLVVLSYIFYAPGLVGVPMREAYVRQSPKAKDEKAWHKALKKSGARFAVNIFAEDGDAEVPTKFFDRKPFTHVGTYAAEAINKNLALLIR